jgi:allophanate hydrolase
MSEVVFQVLEAGPLVSIQDAGRPGHMRYGVSKSGPMDRTSFGAANLAIGNPEGASAIEVSTGGLRLECLSGSVSAVVSGGDFVVSVNGTELTPGIVFQITKDDELHVRAGKKGNWCYLALAGRLNVPKWLGSTATNPISGLGGGELSAGMKLEIDPSEVAKLPAQDIKAFSFQPINGYVRVVFGPQDRFFTEDAKFAFFNSEFAITSAYDRMGIRLHGPTLETENALSIPSEPILKGSIQVAGDGTPTILMADHQTTGGYPKIATVISSDLDGLAQLRPGTRFRFKQISHQDALLIARLRAIEWREFSTRLAIKTS